MSRKLFPIFIALVFFLGIAAGSVFAADKYAKLTTDLISQDDAVRTKAVKELVKAGKPAVPSVVKALQSLEVYTGRANAAVVLGRIGDKSAVPALIKALGDEYTDVKVKSTEALGLLGDKKAVDPIIAAMKEGNYDLKTTGAVALGKLGDKKAVPYLKELEKIQDENLHKAVKTALERLK
ncbi:MAG: HEAT repeat domain-containing protein [Firmicutes bacterium]|nr:HEAT repeat domain-containing protein [Bacillota bacterium]